MNLSFQQVQDLMEKVLVTINGDMNFDSYSRDELTWLYSYCMDYRPDGYKEVLKAVLQAGENKNDYIN